MPTCCSHQSPFSLQHSGHLKNSLLFSALEQSTSMSTMDTPSNITIFRGFPEKGCYTWSPFVTKLEARLRFGGISYNVESGSPMKVPRGKVPYITFDHDGQLQSLADSDLIVRSFIVSGHLEDLNASISPVQKAQDLSIKALLENRLYFLQVSLMDPR